MVSGAASQLSVAPFIDGAVRKSDSDCAIEVIDPSIGRPCYTMPAGSAADVEAAVASARCAFDDGRWSELAPSIRKRTLHRFADLIAADAAALDALDAQEMGKPVGEQFGNAAAAAELMRFYAEAVDKVNGDVFGSDRRSLVVQRRVARGVVGAIVPWNFPTYVAALKLGPAVAAGNCVVLKPSELSSRSALRLAQHAMEAGVPPGVINIVPGLGDTVGKALGLHMDVDMVTFTGSTTVGKLMLQYSGQSNMKPVMTECGGKSPHIVFDDGVDLDSAAEAIARRILTNQGQICSVGSRLLVQRSAEAKLLDRIAACFRRAVIGNALDRHTTFGPLASGKQCARVMRYVDAAAHAGAEIVLGGHRAREDLGGYFVQPTVFRNVPPACSISQEEIFGPILAVTTFEGEQDAIRIANGTIYGLAAYVWTSSLATGMRVARCVRASVFVNAAAPTGEGAGHAASGEPFKQSGIGTEGGLAGMEAYLQRHLVAFSYG